MMRPNEQIEDVLKGKGIFPGQSVSWVTVFGTKRFGCVMGILKDGKVDIQASNARFTVIGVCLNPEPDCSDPITADQREIYA
jgi:hypothetical protein